MAKLETAILSGLVLFIVWILLSYTRHESGYLESTIAVVNRTRPLFISCNEQPSGKQSPLKLVYKGEYRREMKEKMSLDAADDAYYRYLSHRHYICEDYVSLGDSTDGHWDICVVEPYRPRRPCLVYSFGINYDFSFDDAVSAKFGCTVRAFDPSMTNTKEHRRGDNILFYRIGIGSEDKTPPNGWKIRTLSTLVKEFNDTGVIDYLKMDVETSEWTILESMYQSGILSKVKQLGFEVHIMSKSSTTANVFFQHWKTLKRLESFGFRRWYWHFNYSGGYMYKNKPRTCCYELVYINTNFMSKNNTKR